MCPNSSRTNASEFGGRPRNSCRCMSTLLLPAGRLVKARYLERVVFLPAAAGPEDRLAVFGPAYRVERIGLEDRGVHVGREYERVRVAKAGPPFISRVVGNNRDN